MAAGDESRYVMGDIVQNTFYLTLRLNYSVTPELSIQFYGQPFIANGRYDAFKRISAPPRRPVPGPFPSLRQRRNPIRCRRQRVPGSGSRQQRRLFVRQPRLQRARAAQQPGPALAIPARGRALPGLEPGPRRQHRPRQFQYLIRLQRPDEPPGHPCLPGEVHLQFQPVSREEKGREEEEEWRGQPDKGTDQFLCFLSLMPPSA